MSADSASARDQEVEDAQTVGVAIDAMMKGDFGAAEALLLEVVSRTPADYANSWEKDGDLNIKFWDQAEFVHHVMWLKQHGLANRGINWFVNAYPRAHYYLGFICVKRKEYDRAIEYLDQGKQLEPTNPKFDLERAQALLGTGRKREALALFEQFTELGPYVSAHNLSVAIRGRGFVLIELGDLAAAESAFHASLKIEPGNPVALNELRYIQHLRQGGVSAPAKSVPVMGPNMSKCAACGNPVGEGSIVSIDGAPVAICQQCERKLTKKWWQFWK